MVSVHAYACDLNYFMYKAQGTLLYLACKIQGNITFQGFVSDVYHMYLRIYVYLVLMVCCYHATSDLAWERHTTIPINAKHLQGRVYDCNVDDSKHPWGPVIVNKQLSSAVCMPFCTDYFPDRYCWCSQGETLPVNMNECALKPRVINWTAVHFSSSGPLDGSEGCLSVLLSEHRDQSAMSAGVDTCNAVDTHDHSLIQLF